MSFVIRPANLKDLEPLHRLATSLSAQGFLTLPSEKDELAAIISRSQNSFEGKISDADEGLYLFAAEDRTDRSVVGSSLIIARHGTPESPHVFFQVDTKNGVIRIQWETTGRTELGGLILDPSARGHPDKIGKRLSWVRLHYIKSFPNRFRDEILAELLPAFTQDGKSPFWEALGRKFTGMDYREADRLSRKDKRFIESCFPSGEIPIDSLTPEARASLGQPGPETRPVVKILTEVGFHYLNQIDPFDGGPHYGARQEEIRWPMVEDFLFGRTQVKVVIGDH